MTVRARFRRLRDAYRWWSAWQAAGAFASHPDARRRLAACWLDTDDVAAAMLYGICLEFPRRQHRAAEGIEEICLGVER